MLPSHWNPVRVDRLQFLKPIVNKGIEDFHNNSDLKVFINQIKRQIDSKSILLRINLEERRNKLRNLVEVEDKEMAEEHTKRIETIDIQRDRLREFAMRIRNQKEIEHQALAAEKYYQRDRLNDDEIRLAQSKLHFGEILKDWDKLKEIKERIKREEKCEADFWAAQLREENEKMLQRENEEAKQNKANKDEILSQINENEIRKKMEKENSLKAQELNAENVRQLHLKIEQEKFDERMNDKKRKEEFRKALDKHIQLKNQRLNIDKDNEQAFDKIMADENEMAMKADSYIIDKNKRENLKHLKYFIDQQNCVKKTKIAEDKMINELIRKAYIENDKKFKEQQYIKHKKYADLIKTIKDDHANLMAKALLDKQEKALEIKKQKEAMAEFIRLELEKEEIEKEKAKQKQIIYNEALDGQIKFNSDLNKLLIKNHHRELNSMKEAEEDYQKLLKEIKDKEEILFKHPWRS